MRFIALLKGEGDGCDYTIACNKDFQFLKSKDKESAVEECRKLWTDRGGPAGEPGVESITLICVPEGGFAEVLPVAEWNHAALEEREKEEREQEKERLEKRLKELS